MPPIWKASDGGISASCDLLVVQDGMEDYLAFIGCCSVDHWVLCTRMRHVREVCCNVWCVRARVAGISSNYGVRDCVEMCSFTMPPHTDQVVLALTPALGFRVDGARCIRITNCVEMCV